jgi:methionyl-tRNA formyltransferase
VLLVGLGPTSLTALEGLATELTVAAIVRDTVDETTERAGQLGVPVVQDTSIAGVRALVDRLRPDCVVVSSFHRILPADLVQARPFVNVHYAPLPRLRGRATVNWAIINGETETAISIHRLVPGLDAGGILYQERVPIGERCTVAEVYGTLNELQRRALPGVVRAVLAGDQGRPQDEAQASYACTRLPEDGEIDWSRPTSQVDRLVRALLHPFPGAYTWLGLEQLYVDEAEPVTDAPRWEGRVPGRVVRVDRTAGHVDVLTGDGVLRLVRVRRDGEDAAPAATVVRSVRATLGLRLPDLVARLQELEARSRAGL